MNAGSPPAEYETAPVTISGAIPGEKVVAKVVKIYPDRIATLAKTSNAHLNIESSRSVSTLANVPVANGSTSTTIASSRSNEISSFARCRNTEIYVTLR